MKIIEITEIQNGVDDSEQHKVSLSKAEKLDEVMLFFRENPTGGREDFLALAKALDSTREELELLEFELCKSLCSKLGKHVKHGEETVDQAQLAKGISHEMEHTNDEYVARLIALDHLYEIPDYYDQLDAIDKH